MTNNENKHEPINDEMNLAKMTIDEVGADIEEHGHVTLTEENRTIDPSTSKGSLVNVFDEFLPENDTNSDAQKQENITDNPDTLSSSGSHAGNSGEDNNDGTTQTVVLDSTIDSEDEDDGYSKWEDDERKKNVPRLPSSLGGVDDSPDSQGLIYLDYTFTIDPRVYHSPNYQPINVVSSSLQMQNDNSANETQGNEKIEVEKVSEDGLPESVVLDYATFIDGSSFMCYDEGTSVDYTKIVMDAGPKKPTSRQTCKTTFSQCRAKNPLYCRFHGPKLLEKDMKSAISAALGKGCVISVTKDKGQKNPLTFRLTIGCPPQMKKNVEQIVHMFMTQNPGISSSESYKDLGDNQQTMEFDMDVLLADKPPKKGVPKNHFNPSEENNSKAQLNMPKSFKNFFGEQGDKITNQEKGKVKTPMDTVGTTPPKVEEAAAKVDEPSAEEDVYATINKLDGEFDTLYNQANKAMPDKSNDIEAIAQNFEAAKGNYDVEQMESELANLKALMEKYKPEVTGDEGQEQDKKESALASVKEALKGTGYENGDLQYADLGDAGEEVYIANTENSTLKARIKNDGTILFGVETDGVGAFTHNAQEAIKIFEENHGGSANGTKDSSSTSANAPSGFHFVDDAAKKMTGEIDDLAHQNPELISGDDQVSALYYGAQQAIQDVDTAKKEIEEIEEKIKKELNKPKTPTNIFVKIALESCKKKQQETYDSAKANAELSVKNFKEAVEKAKANVVDSIKGTNAEKVENIVKTTVKAIFPHGKPDGVESVVDMIDALDEDMVALVNDKLMVNGKVSPENISKVHNVKDKYSFQKKYKDVEKASQDFDGAISSFKDLIDGVKSKDDAEALKDAVNSISENSQKLKDAFATYKMAVENVKKEVSDLAEMKEKEKKLSQDNGNAQPSEEEIKDAAKKHAINMSNSSDVDGFTNYYAEEISKVISGDGYPKNVDKELPNIGSRRDMAKHYLDMLKDLDGVSPSVIAALQKVVDMPKWGEKKPKKNTPSDTTDLSGDFAKYVGLDTETNGQLKSVSADFYPNLANAISAALQKDGHFTHFNTTNDYDSRELYLSIEKKQKKGFDEDEDTPEIPTDEEKSNIEYMLQRELGNVGLALDYGTAKQSGPKLTWQIVAKPKATKGKTTTPETQTPDPKAAIKAKIAAMSVKEKMEKSIPILEKKLKAEPNNEKWQKMLKQAKAYLASHKD